MNSHQLKILSRPPTLPNNPFRHFPLSNTPIHSLLFDIPVGLGLIHVFLADQQPFGPVYKPDLSHLFFYGQGLCPDLPQTFSCAGHPSQSLDDGLAGGGLWQGKDAVLYHLVKDLIMDLRFYKQQYSRLACLTGIYGKVRAKLVGQGAVDDNEIKGPLGGGSLGSAGAGGCDYGGKAGIRKQGRQNGIKAFG